MMSVVPGPIPARSLPKNKEHCIIGRLPFLSLNLTVALLLYSVLTSLQRRQQQVKSLIYGQYLHSAWHAPPDLSF